jgi:hypothetical protein
VFLEYAIRIGPALGLNAETLGSAVFAVSILTINGLTGILAMGIKAGATKKIQKAAADNADRLEQLTRLMSASQEGLSIGQMLSDNSTRSVAWSEISRSTSRS